MARLVYSIVLCTFALLLAVVETLRSGETCKTLLETDGICQSIKNCKSLQNIIHNPEHKKHLQTLECGVNKVCCPKLENSPSCGTLHKGDRIIEGPVLERSKHPWTVLIFYNAVLNYSAPLCGGALISERHVITAAHCFRFAKISQWRGYFVRFNEIDTSSPDKCTDTTYNGVICREDYEVKSFISHPMYDMNSLQPYAISLLQLATEVKFIAHIRPICLPFDREVQQLPIQHQAFSVVGWGESEMDITGLILRDVEVFGLDNEVCNAKHAITNITHMDKQFCVDRQTHTNHWSIDLKNIDETTHGGPLMRDVEGVWYLIGVGSYSARFDNLNLPGMYTDVVQYFNWIETVIHEERYLEKLLKMK